MDNQESRNKVYRIEDCDVASVKRMADYFDLEDYDDSTHREGERDEEYEQFSQRFFEMGPSNIRNRMIQVEKGDAKQTTLWVRSEDRSGKTEERLINNLHVYAVADKYMIHGLRTLSAAKFRKHLLRCPTKALPNVAALVYEHTFRHDQGLRPKVVNEAAARRDYILQNEEVMGDFETIENFMTDFSQKLHNDYDEEIRSQADHAMYEQTRLETSIKNNEQEIEQLRNESEEINVHLIASADLVDAYISKVLDQRARIREQKTKIDRLREDLRMAQEANTEEKFAERIKQTLPDLEATLARRPDKCRHCRRAGLQLDFYLGQWIERCTHCRTKHCYVPEGQESNRSQQDKKDWVVGFGWRSPEIHAYHESLTSEVSRD